MTTQERRLPHSGTVRELRQYIAAHATEHERRFNDLTAVTVDRPLTDEEIREHRLCHRASLYAWCVAALLGYIAAEHGEEAAYEAAAMVDDMGRNGGAPYCDDLTTTPGASS